MPALAANPRLGATRGTGRVSRAPKRSRARAPAPSASYNPALGAGGAAWDAPPPRRLRGVFQSPSLPDALFDNCSVYDGRDAMEACGGLFGEAQRDCYAVFGVDPAVERFYGVVSALEAALELETSPDEEAAHHGQERC